MTNINKMIDIVRRCETNGLPVNDIHKIAEISLKESYKCQDEYHGALMYLMSLELLMQVDDGK